MSNPLNRLLRNALVYGGGAALSRVLNFLLLPIFTACLAPAEYGILSLLTFFNSLLVPILSLGIGAGMGPCYFDASQPRKRESTVSTAFVLLAAVCAGFLVLTTVLQHQMSVWLFRDSQYGSLVLLAVVSGTLSVLAMPFVLRLQFEERAPVYVFANLLATAVYLFASLLFLVHFQLGVVGILVGDILGQCILFLVTVLAARVPLVMAFTRSVLRELLRLGLPLIPSFFFLFLIQQGNRYLLQWQCGLDGLGVYTVGFSIGMVMSLFVAAFQTAWLPFFMSFVEHRDEAGAVFRRVTVCYVFGFGFICLGVLFLARPVVLLMTAAPYHTAFQIVSLTATSQYLTGLFLLLLPPVYYAKEVESVSIIQGITAAVACALNVALISWAGSLGAGIALVLSIGVMVGVTVLWNHHRRRHYFSLGYEWKRFGPFGLFLVAAHLLFLRQRTWSMGGELTAAAAGILLSAGFISLAMRHEERRYIRDKLVYWTSSIRETRNASRLSQNSSR